MNQKVTYTEIYETALGRACNALQSLGYEVPSRRERTTANDIKRHLVSLAIKELKPGEERK